MAGPDLQEHDRLSDSLNPAEIRQQEGSAPSIEHATDDQQAAYDRELKVIEKGFGETASDPTTKATGASDPQKMLGGDHEGAGDGLYNPKPQAVTAGNKVQSFFKKHKKAILIGGAGGGGLVGIIIVLVFLASSLLMPHFAEGIMGYGFARAGANFRQGQQQLLARKLGNDAADDTKYSQLKNKFIKLKKWAFLEKYRPAKIAQNMLTQKELDFKVTPRSGLFSRARISAVIIHGEEIPITKPSFFKPFGNQAASLQLASSIDSALAKQWRGPKGVVGTMIRTKVGVQILSQVGVRGLFAWVNRGLSYRGKSNLQADLDLQAASYRNVTGSRRTPTSLVENTNKAATEAAEALEHAATGHDADARNLAKTGELPDAAVKAAARASGSVATDIVGAASTFYGIAVPACLIVDGSMQRSGPLIDARMARLERSAMWVASAADQQRAGDVTGEALAAAYRKFNPNGAFSRSSLQQIMEGSRAKSDLSPPESDAAGNFSILNVYLPDGAAEVANAAADTVCPVLTNFWFGVGSGLAEIVAGFFTGGGYTAASKAGAEGVRIAFTQYLKLAFKQIATKATLKKFVRTAAITGGLELLAFSIAAQHAQLDVNGTSRGQEAVDEATAGGIGLGAEFGKNMGGIPQTSDDIRNNRIQDQLYTQKYTASLGMRERYFSISNPESLLSRVAISVGTQANISAIGSFLTMLGNMFSPSRLVGSLTSAFAPKVSAATATASDPFRIVNFAFSAAEEQVIATHSTYWDILENDYVLQEQHPDQFADIQKTYGHCFTDSVGTLLQTADIMRDSDGNVVADEGACSPNNLGRPLNSDKILSGEDKEPVFASSDAEMVFRWRISMRSDKVIDSTQEIQDIGGEQ